MVTTRIKGNETYPLLKMDNTNGHVIYFFTESCAVDLMDPDPKNTDWRVWGLVDFNETIVLRNNGNGGPRLKKSKTSLTTVLFVSDREGFVLIRNKSSEFKGLVTNFNIDQFEDYNEELHLKNN